MLFYYEKNLRFFSEEVQIFFFGLQTHNNNFEHIIPIDV